jgi:uncharacterized iron-regulated protein
LKLATKFSISICALFFSSNALAFDSPSDPPFIVENDGSTLTSAHQIASEIKKGSILILGELHDNADHHNNQLEIVRSLLELGHKVDLGMEFLNYTDQFEIYKYGAGLTSKGKFLENIQWKTPESFEFYSPMIDAVHQNNGSVLGLNIPRLITTKVAQNGVNSLSNPELSLLPYPLELGNNHYFERFYQAVGGGHVPDEKIENYFWSQSIWDDVMSWKALEHMEKNPTRILVIIVGDFHVSYGGGLKELIERKGFTEVKTVSQTVKGDSTEQELSKAIAPHLKYGARADWIWVTE